MAAPDRTTTDVPDEGALYQRLPILKMFLATLAGTVLISAVMVPIRWNGQQGSTAAAKIDTLLDVMIVLSSFVFSLVMVMLFYALWKFRAKPGDEGDGEPIHGNTRIEVAWTVIPTVIVLFGAGYSAAVLNNIEERQTDRMVVDVYSQQFNWNFTYPEAAKYSQGELHVPVDRQVEFKLHALDVIHSFWVPEWRIKKDNVPGIITHAIVTPDREGTYNLICTELCGFGHATMRAKVVVESEPDFKKWLSQQQEPPEAFTGTGGSNTQELLEKNETAVESG
ncbi:MAG: cytochrome c oxidase subunit II [Actinomycetota bacterium]